MAFNATARTFSSASVVYSTFVSVGLANDQQVARIFASNTNASTTATLMLALINRTTGACVAAFPASCAASAVRTGADGASGDYLYTVTFTEGGTSKVDLMGSGGGNTGGEYEWRLGCTALSAGTLTAYVAHDTEV